MTGPRFSVIITTFSRPASLARTLAALARADYPHSEFEVIVVDDGGSEPLDEIVAGCSNTKTGLADEVKVLRSTGYRELDASAVMTLFKWKFQPGTVDHCLAIDSLGEMIGYLFGSGQTMGTLTEMEFHRRRFMNRHDKRALL